ncbi:MAG: hypothetical protein H7X80_07305 [bacterium]|nr:hypothetical protein [Candidatus Kapabacteria bacterium]
MTRDPGERTEPRQLRADITFLNHGILPMVGREADLGRIVAFWRDNVAESELRALLIIAEAGMGKSRLADELVRNVEHSAGAALHVRFYPDAALSLAPLLSRATNVAAERAGLPATATDNGVGALRRLAALRPTMMILEDLHLLHGNPLRELHDLLAALRDLPIALVVLTRPIELAVRGVIDPFIGDEFTLEGLNADTVARMLREVFAGMESDWVVMALYEATLGNPLALRAALRSAVTSGAIASSNGETWRVAIDRESFIASIARGVHVLIEGMIAHLDSDERANAQLLAELGEVFAPETARILLPDADAVIDALLFRGVLAPLDLPISPLVGTITPTRLVAFSHTLLHRALVGNRHPGNSRAVEAIAAGVPLYSLRLIEGIASDPATGIDPEHARIAVDELARAAIVIDNTTDWQVAPDLIAIGDALLAAHASSWEHADRQSTELRMHHVRVNTMRRHSSSQEYRDRLAAYVAATAVPLPDSRIGARISAVKSEIALGLSQDRTKLSDAWERMEAIITECPAGLYVHPYGFFLRTMLEWADVYEDRRIVPMIEARYDEIDASEMASPETKEWNRRERLIKLAVIFDTAEQLDARLQSLDEVATMVFASDGELGLQTIRLYDRIGRVDHMLAAIDVELPRFEGLGLMRNAGHARLLAITEQAAFGDDLDEIASRTLAMIVNAPEHTRARLEESARELIAMNSVLRGDAESVAERIGKFAGDKAWSFDDELWLIVAIVNDASADVRQLVGCEHIPRALRLLARHLFALDAPSIDEVIDATREALRAPMLTKRHVLATYAIVHVFERLAHDGRDEIAKVLATRIVRKVEQTLSWLEERRLGAYIPPFVAVSKRWFTRREAEAWKARGERITNDRRRDGERSSATGLIAIRMLGAIEVRRGDGNVVPIRGARLRALLGTLVADRMLKEPLAHREFARIASGDEDVEHARKTMNGAVLRLREVLGDDAILTDGETPRLNDARVRIDLLEAMAQCARARDAVRARMLAQALAAMNTALDAWNGDVAFPSLYDSFFEAAREDFENTMRTTLLATTNALIAEDDPAGAEMLLRRAATMMRGDGEIDEKLISVVEMSGRRAEAERLRMATT